MASISTKKGTSGDTLRAIQFFGSDKIRRSIRLGTLPATDGNAIKDSIDLLEVNRKTGRQPDADRSLWLGRVDNSIYNTRD